MKYRQVIYYVLLPLGIALWLSPIIAQLPGFRKGTVLPQTLGMGVNLTML